MDKMITLPISRVKKETESHVTIFFKHALDFRPGQFIMLWLPRVDEKPFTVSYHDKDEFGVTIEAKGEFTKKIVKMQKGELLGIRGPFGNGFEIVKKKKVCVVSGGCGMAPIAPLIEVLIKNDNHVTIIQGARTKDALLFPKRFSDVIVCTDDGSSGRKGFTTEVLVEELEKNDVDMVYACGPEIMMKIVNDICVDNGVNCQVSLERYMRCGFGICGACVCGKERVCIDGPVFDSKKIEKMEDFGKSALLKSGKEVALDKYFMWRCK